MGQKNSLKPGIVSSCVTQVMAVGPQTQGGSPVGWESYLCLRGSGLDGTLGICIVREEGIRRYKSVLYKPAAGLCSFLL